MYGVESLEKKVRKRPQTTFLALSLLCSFYSNVSVSLELFKCSLNTSTFPFLSCWMIYIDRQLLADLSCSGTYIARIAMSCFFNFPHWRPIWHSLYFFCKQRRKVFPLLISDRRDIPFPVTIPEKN